MCRSNSIISRSPLRRASSAATTPASPLPEDNDVRRTSTYGFERRRSNLAKSAASFQKLLGTTFKYGRETSGTQRHGTDNDGERENANSHDRFLSLPNELHVQVLCALSLPDILALRLTSRSFRNLVRNSQALLVRHHTRNVLTAETLALYPAPSPKSARLTYLLNQHRCSILSCNLAGRITDFIMVEILSLDSERHRRNFRAVEERLAKRITPLIFALNHFFDESRARLLEQKCNIGIVGLAPALMMGGCSRHLKDDCACMRALAAEVWTVNQDDIMGTYNPSALLDYHHMFILLVSAVARQLRPPTYANRFERALRGQSNPPAKLENIATVFVLGGLQQVEKIMGHRTYANRRKALDAFMKGLSPAESVRWRDNWGRMLGTDDITKGQVNYAMKCVPDMQYIWTPTAQQLLLTRKTIRHVREIQSAGEFITELAT